MLTAAFNFNDAAIRRELDDVGMRVLPKALAQMLNDTAFKVRDTVAAEVRSSVDRPKPFTLRPMKVTKARHQDGDRMFASVDMPPIQADYLYFAITGEQRHPGDPGTARADIMTFSSTPTAFGGAFNKTAFKRLSKRHQKEQTERAALRTQRAGHQGRLPPSLRWVVRSRNAPGVFFGEVNGTKGYWQRPDRYTKRERDSIIGAARGRQGHIGNAGVRGGSNLSWTKPGSQLKLLAAFKPRVDTPVTIHYDQALFAGYGAQMTQGNFLRVLQEKKAWELSRS